MLPLQCTSLLARRSLLHSLTAWSVTLWLPSPIWIERIDDEKEEEEEEEEEKERGGGGEEEEATYKGEMISLFEQ